MPSYEHIYSPQTSGMAAGERALAVARREFQMTVDAFKDRVKSELSAIAQAKKDVAAHEAFVSQKEADNWLKTSRVAAERTNVENEAAMVKRDKEMVINREKQVQLLFIASFLISDLSFKSGSVNIPPSSLFTQASLDQSLSDTDGENQNSHRNNWPNITYHIQNCGQVHINSHNSQGNKFINSGNNAPKIINHGGPMVDPDINDDDSNPLTAEEVADETADKDEDTESPYASCSESCPGESIHSKPIVVPLDPHHEQSGGFQQWNGLPPPFMAQSVFPGFSPSFPPGFSTLLPQNDPQYQNQFIGVPPGFIPPPIPEEGRSSKRNENSHQAMQQCIPGMAFGASPSPAVGNNALENPQQYPTNAALSQAQNFLTQVQNHTQPSGIPNNFVDNNVFSDTNHHARESPHRGLPLSDCLRGTREDKVKRLEHLLESALETAKLIQADETIPESDALGARGSTIFKSLQSLLQSPVRKDPDSQPKAQRRKLFSWSQVRIRIPNYEKGTQ